MTRTHIFWLSALAVAAAALGAHAQDIQTPAAAAPPGPPKGDPAMLERVDRNGDGRITRIEARADAGLARRFSALDVDNSDSLDSGEFARFEIDGEPPLAAPNRTR